MVTCDEQGGFTFKGAPAGSNGELSAPHDRDANGRRTRVRTVMPFDVPDLDPVEVPDLVVPAQKPPASLRYVFPGESTFIGMSRPTHWNRGCWVTRGNRRYWGSLAVGIAAVVFLAPALGGSAIDGGMENGVE